MSCSGQVATDGWHMEQVSSECIYVLVFVDLANMWGAWAVSYNFLIEQVYFINVWFGEK